MEDDPTPPTRRELLLAIWRSDRLERALGSDWDALPAWARRELLRNARKLERLLKRAGFPPE